MKSFQQISNFKKHKQLVRYLISGTATFLVENIAFFAIFYILIVELKIANIMSIGIAVIVNFMLNKYFVFQNRQSDFGSMRQILRYGILVVFNMILSTAGLTLLTDLGLSTYIGKPLMTVFIAFTTYYIFRKLIFTPPNTK